MRRIDLSRFRSLFRALRCQRVGPRHRRGNSKGVAVFFMVGVIGIVLGFLMLVVNTGMIVYQKIRLQTAADLAAYSAAAVQASYLGTISTSQEPNSIAGINNAILKRYEQLQKEMHLKGTDIVPWPTLIPIPSPAGAAICMALCTAANMANAKIEISRFRKGVEDLEKLRMQAAKILAELPAATRRAAEATLRANIPDLDLGEGAIGSAMGKTTNKWEDVTRSAFDSNTMLNDKKNAALTFSSEKGMYLANIVGAVPHSYPFYGIPGVGAFCIYDKIGESGPTDWYCPVNGAGARPHNYQSAFYAWVQAVAGLSNPNPLDRALEGGKAKAIRLNFVQNDHRPGPFAVVAAEWYPTNGSFMNMENSLGATGSLFPKQTRLVAVSAAEPFGSHFAALSSELSNSGVRLQSIRKLLLDKRMDPVRSDFPGLFDYMQALGPLDQFGRPTEKAEDVIRRFLH